VELPTHPWQRQRYWIASPALQARAGEATGHPLLGVRVSLAGAEAMYEAMLSRAEHSWLYDHRVGDAALMPGAGLGELVRAAGEHRFGGAAVEVLSLVLQAPLVLPEHGGQRVQVLVSEEDGRTGVSVYSRRAEASPEAMWTLHASGEVRRASAGGAGRIDLAAVRGRCTERVEVAQAYEAFASAGLGYGPAFQGLQSLWRGANEAIAEVSLPDGVEGAERYGVHPALLDAAFQSLSGIAQTRALYVPFAMDKVSVHASGATAAAVYVRTRQEESGGASADGLADVTLTDARGHVLVEVVGLHGRAVEAEGLHRAEGIANALYQLGWSASPPPPASAPSGRWVVVAGEQDGVTDDVVERLRTAGAACMRVDIAGLAAALPAEHVVCMWRRVDDGADAAEAAPRLASEGLSIMQLLAKQGQVPRLWWVTRGAVAVTAQEAADVAQASLWGLGRTVMQEHPELACALIDVEDRSGVADQLVCELTSTDGEREIAWRAGERRVARLTRAAGATVPDAENYALATTHKGTLDGLVLAPAGRRRPARGEVEIEVRASGLNFRDVLNALGMYPGEAGPLGSECAGVVIAVGEDIEGVAIGDAVMALAPGSFGRFVVANSRLVARVPSGLSFEQAATIPVAFLTAWYALHDLAGLKAGEQLLVHAAAGGVGMAAVEIAQWIGAEVFGTASAAKWEVVRSLGVKAVAHSRDLSFVEAIRSATGGANVDVVLNALSGKFVDASLSLLGAGGRFIELGKTDIREAAAVSVSHPGVRYRAFDLLEAGIERLAALLASIVEGFAVGRLTPLPVRTFAITEAEVAFRFMAQARHVGKLALVPLRSLRTEGTVLVTGGLGALGLHVARWLAQRGVRHLVLTGRRGRETPGATEAVVELESLGARVTVAAMDVSKGDAVRTLLKAIPADLPLRGVVHAAGVLDDGMLSEQSAERLARVLAPKVGGACHLDALTREADLDFFVLFSSAAGTLGSAGQGGYAAANACLDALAARRRAEGLPAQSLAWGLWTDASSRAAGLASGLDSVQQARLEKSGLSAVDPSQGIALFEAVLGRSEAQLMPVPIELGVLRKAFGEAVPPLWRGLVRAAPPLLAELVVRKPAVAADEKSAKPSKSTRVRDAIIADSTYGHSEFIEGHLREWLAQVLRLPGSRIEGEHRLTDLGVDSLMAIELRNRVYSELGVTVTLATLLSGPTLRELATQLSAQIASSSSEQASMKTALSQYRGAHRELIDRLKEEQPDTLAGVIHQFSEDTVDALLKELNLNGDYDG
jgi:NADPH:quinone reductase-like Zn-dependent oxidoreductase/acyl carrier protein